MRARISGILLFALCNRGYCQGELPRWLTDATAFCTELAHRTNGKTSAILLGTPNTTGSRITKCARLPSSVRAKAIIGKYDWTDKANFGRVVKSEAAKGPDFAGRYAIIEWSCGSWCTNSVIANILNGKAYDTPFGGVVGCRAITGDLPTMQPRANSSLLIVRGSLEMSFNNSLSEGPCGTFYFRWTAARLCLIGCDIPKTN
jgi:hypothetical protein